MAARVRKGRSDRKDYADVESWQDEDCKLTVTQPAGWMCKVSLETKIGLPPGELYDLLTQPDNSKVFRSIKALKSRKVLTDDRRGRQVVEVEQEAVWKFLCFGGTFTTKLIVDQNRRSGEIGFKLAESGMMKNFEGVWQIQPLSKVEGSQGQASKKQPWLDGPMQALKNAHQRFAAGGGATEASLLTLEQSVLPNVVPPKPLDRLLKGIAARQVRCLVEDVRMEVHRRRQEKSNSEQPRTWTAPAASVSLRHLQHISVGRRLGPSSLPPVVRRGRH